MGWRARMVGLVIAAGGVGAAVLLLKDSHLRATSEKDIASSYSQAVAIKLGSGQPVQIHISRCEVGATRSERILKVYAEIENPGSTEIPRRRYSFALADSKRTLYRDRSAEEDPESNTCALRPGERRDFVFKYVVEPIATRSALDLVSAEGGTNFIQVKTSLPLELTLAEGEWRVFRVPTWK